MELESVSSSEEEDSGSTPQPVIDSTAAALTGSSIATNGEPSRSITTATVRPNDAGGAPIDNTNLSIQGRRSASRNRVSTSPPDSSSTQPTSSDLQTSDGTAQPIARGLTEEEPPTYLSLFPKTSSAAHQMPISHHSQPQPRLSTNQTPYPTASVQSPSHHPSPTSMPHYRCSVCSTAHQGSWINQHNSYHTTPDIPGALGHHYPEHHHPSSHTQYHHTTVPPMHHRSPIHGNVPDDYLKLSFVCVLLCTLQLNFPALLCVLPALAYSLRAQKLNTEGRHTSANKYGRGALICNLCALTQYLLCAVIVIALLYVWVFNSL